MHLQFWPAFSPSTSTTTTLHFQTEHVCPARHTTRLQSLWNRTKRTIYSRFYQVSCNKKIHDQHQLRIWDFERAVPTLVSHQLMVLVRIHKCRRLTAQAPCISCGGGKTGMGAGGHSCYIWQNLAVLYMLKFRVKWWTDRKSQQSLHPGRWDCCLQLLPEFTMVDERKNVRGFGTWSLVRREKYGAHVQQLLVHPL